MDLQQLANVLSGPSIPYAGSKPLWGRAYEQIQSEIRTAPTVASALAQIVCLTDEYAELLVGNGLDPTQNVGRDVMLIERSDSGHVIVIADRGLPDEVRRQSLRIGGVDLAAAAARFRRLASRRLQQSPWLADPGEPGRVIEILPEDLADLHSVEVMMIHKPLMVQSSAPFPPWLVSPRSGTATATAGCRVHHNSNGSTGVTTARHLFSGSGLIGTPVTVDGHPGTVAAEDSVTDSVFIEMNPAPTPSNTRGTSGFLRGMAPRLNDQAEFEGSVAGHTTTAIQGMDPGLTLVSPTRQSRVYTPAVTNPGDSGAALIETTSDLVIGFAHERTPASALVEWSSWVWADSVFTALDVQPR